MSTPGDNQQLGIMDNKLVQSRFGRGILSLKSSTLSIPSSVQTIEAH